jgi:hypothetical protein
VEYTVSYIYHSLAAFMDRDNVGLPGFAAYFKASSDEERHHANLLMAQQNRRGGRVKLKVCVWGGWLAGWALCWKLLRGRAGCCSRCVAQTLAVPCRMAHVLPCGG